MELKKMALASPPSAPPRGFRLDSAGTSPYATAPSSPRGGGRLVPSDSEGAGAGGGMFLTAPPSPNPFDLLPPGATATPRLAGSNPFDLFQHFTSAPASPRRAAAIYAHFAAEGNGGGSDAGGRHAGDSDSDGDEEFQPRRSYATRGGSSVPFDWEERPGTPKRGFGGGAAVAVAAGEAAAWDTEFDFGTQVGGKGAPAETLTAADELFEKGKIRPLRPPKAKTADEPKVRPLKPPPGLLDGGSVASSPRSPVASRGGGAMWSPRRRSRVSSGVDFDPFTAALLEATKAPAPPSPLGSKRAAAPGSPPKKRPASRSAGWRRWRLSDLLLFRSSSDGGGRVNNKHDPDVKPVQPFAVPVKKASALPPPPPATIKAGAKGDDWKQRGNRNNAAAAAESVAGCARLSPLQRLAKGLGAYSWHHHHRGLAAPPATKG